MSALEPVAPADTMQYIENKTYDEIAVGDHAELTRTLKPQDIELFAGDCQLVCPSAFT